jgi:hypothetical protein
MADNAWLAIAGVMGGIVGAAVTGSFNYVSHKGEIDAKMIELTVGILRSEPSPETEPLREWAIGELERRARFEFDDQQRAVLLKRELPYKQMAELLSQLSRDIEQIKQQQPDTELMQKMIQMMLREKGEKTK